MSFARARLASVLAQRRRGATPSDDSGRMLLVVFVCIGAGGWLSGNARPRRFRGARHGVTADVDLNLDTRLATVRLSGLPLGGTIDGTATLRDAGDPVLDDALARALARRGVRIEAVDMDPGLRTCRVVAMLPFARRLSVTLAKIDTV